MDTPMEAAKASEINTSPTPSAPSKPDKPNNFFSHFGKVVLFLLIAGGLVFAGYYFGKQGYKKDETTKYPTQTMSQSPTEAPVPPTATPIGVGKRTIKGGLLSGTSFKLYAVEVPNDWKDNHETSSVTDKLVLTKDSYSLTIYQAAFGGGGCTYKGEPEVEMAQKFTEFADISGKSANYRRSWNPDAGAKTTYTICQKNTTDSSYGSLTEFGAISAVSPSPLDNAVIAEIDSIIASLTKQ